MYIFINGTDRTSQVINNSIKIKDELQERINSLSLSVAGFNPSYFDDIKAYEGFSILSATSTTITLNKNYNTAIQNNIFRIGSIVTFAIGLSDEETGTVTKIDNDNGNLRLTFSTFKNTPVQGELAGIKRFAGNIIDVSDKNQTILENITFDLKCLDYTRIFDKSLLNDTYKNRDARYIVNDFCNKTINNNQTIDQFDYTNTTDLRTSWIESGDGENPTLDTINYRETTGAGNFDWIYSTGTANFTNNFTSTDITTFTDGLIGLWYKASNYSTITSVEVRLGSDTSNYCSFSFTPTDNEWVYYTQDFSNITGSPDWANTDYIEIIVNQTASSSILIDGIRILEKEFFRHYPYVQTSVQFTDFRIPRVKPTEILQRLADELGWYWYIDYDRNIKLFPEDTTYAPFSLNETSNNFKDLSIQFDTSRLINRQVVRGGNETSEDTYSQTVEGDGHVREWILKNKFKNLVVKKDDNSITDTMESGTTETNVTATAHGLETGDYIVNRTRSNAVRQIIKVDEDNFTVETVTGQTSGDTFSTFVEQTVGVEGLDAETSKNFMSNFNEKSIRNAEEETTLATGEFLQFTYNEGFPILVQRTDNVSVTNVKDLLGYSDGVFDGQPITDRTIESRAEAINLAEAKIKKYSNVVISASFRTNQEGLESGQLIDIKDTTKSQRNINQSFLIQSVSSRQVAWGENIYTVRCSSLLFGFLELFQQLLSQNRKIKVDADEIINNIEDGLETLTISDILETNINGETVTDELTLSDTIETKVLTPPFKWGRILEGDLLLEDGTSLLLEDGTSLLLDSPDGPKFIWNLSSWN